MLDVSQWLHKCPIVNAVIIMDIQETEKPNPRMLHGTAGDRVRRLFEIYTNYEGREFHSADSW